MSSKNKLSLKNETNDKPNPSLHEKAERILQLKEETRVNSDKKYSLLEMQEICHDLEVHEIELEMQNEELIHTYQELDNSNKRYFDFYNLAPVGYLTLSEEGLILEANLTSSTLLGISTQILIQKPVSHFILQEDQDIYYLYNKSFSDQTKQPSCELRMLHSDGTSFWVQLESSTQNSDGIVLHRLIISPINERKKAQEELRIAAIAFKSQNGMAITNPDGIIERINPAFTALTGYSEEESIGKTMAIVKSERHSLLFYQRMWESIKQDYRWQGEIWNKRKNGEIYPELLTITAVTADDLSITHYIASFSDITEDKEAEAQIHRLAYYDHLTSLPNRRLLQDRLIQAIAATSRHSAYGAIFFIDLDKFKLLNDTHGHDIGDLLLVEIAQRLKQLVRKSDTVARHGGDEFMILLEDLSVNIEEAATLANQLGEKIFESMQKPFFLKTRDYYAQMSIGVTLLNSDDTVEDLFKHADIALYQAKNSGRNTLRFFDPTMQATLDLHSALEAELREALSKNQFRLYYQPQVDELHRVGGVEALIRWLHPERGLISPDDFIPLAEESDLILPIGLWVLQSACEQLKIWKNNPHTAQLNVAVNVSSRQFRQPDFVPQIQQVLQNCGVNPSLLKLELTESLVLENVEETIQKMAAIQHLGVNFSMDDFGTGFSSLSYLAQLPLNQLKIDKSFVNKIFEHRDNEMIARTIIAMGIGLGMNVIAEGVETIAQQKFLEASGCLFYQGYLFSRPLPIEELEVYLQQN